MPVSKRHDTYHLHERMTNWLISEQQGSSREDYANDDGEHETLGSEGGKLPVVSSSSASPVTLRRALRQGDHRTLLSLLWSPPSSDNNPSHPHDGGDMLLWRALARATRLGRVETLRSLLRLRMDGLVGWVRGEEESTDLDINAVLPWSILQTGNTDMYDEEDRDDGPPQPRGGTTTLLSLAASLADPACTQLLLQHGAYPLGPGVIQSTQKCRSEVRHPHDAVPRTEDHDCPLWTACRYGRLATVRCLVDSLMFPTFSNEVSLSVHVLAEILAQAVSLTCRYGHAHLLAYWCRDPAPTDDQADQTTTTTTVTAAAWTYMRQQLIGTPPDGMWSPWFDAAWGGHVTCLQVLAEAGKNLKESESFAHQSHHTGANNDNVHYMRPWLLDDRGGTQWQRACAGTHPSRLQRVWEYLQEHVDPSTLAALIAHADTDGDTALCVTAWDDRTMVLQWLLDHLVMTTNNNDDKDMAVSSLLRRPIIRACENGQASALSVLLLYCQEHALEVASSDIVDEDDPQHLSCIEKAILYAHHDGGDEKTSSSETTSNAATGYPAVLRLVTQPPYQWQVKTQHVRLAVQLGRVECLHILLQARPSLVKMQWQSVGGETEDQEEEPQAFEEQGSEIESRHQDDGIHEMTSIQQNETRKVTVSPLNILQVSAPLCQPGNQSHLEYLWFLINLIVAQGLIGYFECTNTYQKTAWKSAVYVQNYPLAAVLSDPLLTCCTYDDIMARLQVGQNLTERGLMVPRRRPPKGWTCLHTACCLGRTEVVAYLLQLKGINVAAATTHGWTALHWAARHGHVDIGRLLLAHYGTPSVQHALHVGPASKVSALLTAARHGHTELVRSMLATPENAFDANAVGESDNTALYLATYEGHEDTVGILLSQPGVALDYINADGETCLQRACLNQDEGIVRRLLEMGSRTDQVHPDTGECALHYAAACGFGDPGTSILALLLDHGADLHQARKDGWTPLHCAVWAHNEELLWDLGQPSSSEATFAPLRLLVQWGANVDAVDEDENTPLDLAGHPSVRRCLESLLRERHGTRCIYGLGGLNGAQGVLTGQGRQGHDNC